MRDLFFPNITRPDLSKIIKVKRGIRRFDIQRRNLRKQFLHSISFLWDIGIGREIIGRGPTTTKGAEASMECSLVSLLLIPLFLAHNS